MRFRIDKETKCFVDISFSGRMEVEALTVGLVTIRKGQYVGAYWNTKTKTAMVRAFGGSWTNPMRISKKYLGHVVSTILIHNGLEGYLWVSHGRYEPIPQDLFGHPMDEETIVGQ